jgi:hypothetical protein
LNYSAIEEFFLGCLDLSMLSAVSIELQSYMTAGQARQYADTEPRVWCVVDAVRGCLRPRSSAFAGIDFET